MSKIAITAEVEGLVPGTLRDVYDFFREIDVTTVLTGYGPFPPVVSVENPGGRWDAPKQVRTMRLGDGSSLRETLTQLDPPNAFLYSLDQITSPLRMLVGGLHGRWSFRELSDAEGRPMTLAHWHYTFEPHSWLTWLPSFLIVKGFWRIYMAKTLERATAQAVGPSPSVRLGTPL